MAPAARNRTDAAQSGVSSVTVTFTAIVFSPPNSATARNATTTAESSLGCEVVNEGIGTAYRIRTDDLRLERAVSWASRRMRHGRPAESRRGQARILAVRLQAPRWRSDERSPRFADDIGGGFDADTRVEPVRRHTTPTAAVA